EGTSTGYHIFAVRSDGAIFTAQLGLPPSQATASPLWVPLLIINPISVREIAWDQTANGLAAVGTDSRVYTLPGGAGYWKLLSNGPVVALLPGEDGTVEEIVGGSGTSTTFSPLVSPVFGAIPPQTNGFPLSNVDPNAAFTATYAIPLSTQTFSAKTTPASCNIFGCYSLVARDNLGYAPQIQHAPSSWTDINMDFPPWGAGYMWSIASAANYRSKEGDVFVIGRNFHLLEWVPF
ncbi:MAG TPA: hypothetical protein VGI10_03810, partial [Polyangiaceae bacterium]